MPPVTPVANYPSSLWDTLSQNRDSRDDYIEPGPPEYLRVISELEAVQKHTRPVADDLAIWVAPWGVAANANGSRTNPYATIAAAIAAVSATKKIIMLLPGTYTPSAVLALPTGQTDVKIIGLGGSSVVTITGADLAQVFSLTPGAQGAAYAITLEGMTINQFAAKKGLYITDASIDGTVTVNLKDMKFVMDTSGSSIDLLHVVATGVIINMEDCLTTGPITLDCYAAADAFTYTRCILTGGVASDAGAVAAAFLFFSCEILSTGFTGGHSSQTVTALYCRTSADVLGATGDFGAGSHTETLTIPVS